MKRTTLIAVLVAFALMAALPASASAGAFYCSPSGDFCQRIGGTKKRPIFFFDTFSLRGKIDVCVKAPEADWTCKSFPLRRAKHGIYKSKVRWHKHFEHAGAGTYSVKWTQGESTIGRALKFKIR